MRRMLFPLVILAASVCLSAQQARQTPTELLAAARAAIGADKLATVKAFRLKGESEALNGWSGLRPGAERMKSAIELKALLPAHYLSTRALIGPDGRVMPASARGFADQVDIGGAVGFNLSRVDFARLMLLLFLRTDTSLPLTLRPDLSSENELQFDGAHELHCSLVLDPSTHTPTGLRVTLTPGQPPGFASTGPLQEVMMSIVGRRAVDGLSVPDHLVVKNLVDQKVLEEYWFREIEINPTLSATDFKR